MSETRFYLYITIVVALGLCGLISSVAWPVAWHNRSVTIEAMQRGYEQRSVPGQPGVYWVKATDDRR